MSGWSWDSKVMAHMRKQLTKERIREERQRLGSEASGVLAWGSRQSTGVERVESWRNIHLVLALG
jgi:hypothetical protein